MPEEKVFEFVRVMGEVPYEVPTFLEFGGQSEGVDAFLPNLQNVAYTLVSKDTSPGMVVVSFRFTNSMIHTVLMSEDAWEDVRKFIVPVRFSLGEEVDRQNAKGGETNST